MLERAKSKSGQNILMCHGRLLCSQIDPVREANQWVEKNHGQLRGQKQVVVLGVGCGYHLVSLEKIYPEVEITAIDVDSEFIEFTRKEHSLLLPRTKLITINNSDKFKKNPFVLNLIQTHYAILKFAPSIVFHEKIYSDFFDLLIGRSEVGLQFILSNRQDLAKIISTTQIRLVTNELISIKTLSPCVFHECNKVESLVFSALRELVT